MESNKENSNVRKIAILVSCASVLQVMESIFPHPIPGVRLGLPNVITLICLVDIGFAASLEVAVLRTLVSSFVLGTFLSPTFVLSFSGAFFSAVVMGLTYRITLKFKRVFLSIVGISLIGAVTHNLTQIILVYLLLIKQKEIFLLLPWLGISAVVMGWFNGLVVSGVCRRLGNPVEEINLQEKQYSSNNPFNPVRYTNMDSPVNFLLPEVKIVFVVILALIILLLENPYFYLFVLFLFIVIAYFSGISVLRLFVDMKKMSLFILSSLFVPVVFNSTGEILFSVGIFKITSAGLYSGTLFAVRIILLTLISSFLVRTTPAEKLIAGLKKVLFPLQKLGISGQRTASIIILAWDSMPEVWGKINSLMRIKKYEFKKLTKLVSALSSLITIVYREAEKN